MESNSQYAKRDYWDKRFETEKEFEWLTGLDEFKDIILPQLNKDYRIAHIGCGSSQVSMQLYNLGFNNITNIDYSEVLIEKFKQLYSNMKWVADDITTLNNIESYSFDVVFEKATIEAILVNEKSAWEPSDEALKNIENIFSSVHRVLKMNGIFISVSFTQPHFRVPALLRQKDWSIECIEFGKSFHYYVYICRKGQKVEDDIKNRYSSIAKSWLREIEEK